MTDEAKKECPECGWEIKHEYSRCLHCGARLDGKVSLLDKISEANVGRKIGNAGKKLDEIGKGMMKTGCSLTSGCFSLIFLFILLFILYAVLTS